MPVVQQANASLLGETRRTEHQEKVAPTGFVSDEWFALVHTPVKNWQNVPEARKAVDKEWDKLDNPENPAWMYETVCEYADVVADYIKKGKPVHFGDLMRLCHIKHSELAAALQSYKGRIVFRGDNIKDETGYLAVFSEQGTSASHLGAAKFLDAIARMPGNDGAYSDARGAYHQTELQGVDTYVSLPRDKWKPEWHGKYTRPVVRLRLNLYGHPLAGLFWERFCTKAILDCGFERVKSWECLFKHTEKQLFLSVYVDDFKMAGKAENLPKMWEQLGKKLILDPPTPLHHNVYLGCGQQNIEPPAGLLAEKFEFFNSTLMRNRMEPSAANKPKASVDPIKSEIPDKQATPVVGRGDENRISFRPIASPNTKFSLPMHGETRSPQHKTKAYQYVMGHAEQCILKYLELAKLDRSSLKKVPTPCIDDHQIAPEDFENTGKLSPVCAKIVLKCLFLARMLRPDTLWTVNVLAREVTKWNPACDKKGCIDLSATSVALKTTCRSALSATLQNMSDVDVCRRKLCWRFTRFTIHIRHVSLPDGT